MTPDTDLMKRFLEYVARFDANFHKRIKGATSEQIHELQKLAGQALPATYVDFLIKMGADTGGLHLSTEGTTDISELINYYRKDVAPGEMPANCILMGFGAISMADFALYCTGNAEPHVVFRDLDTIVGLYAESLEKLLFRSAFEHYRLPQFPQKIFLTASFVDLGHRDQVDAARRIVERYVEILPFSDSHFICAESAEMAIAITQYENLGMGVTIAGKKQSDISRMASAMMREFRLKIG